MYHYRLIFSSIQPISETLPIIFSIKGINIFLSICYGKLLERQSQTEIIFFFNVNRIHSECSHYLFNSNHANYKDYEGDVIENNKF